MNAPTASAAASSASGTAVGALLLTADLLLTGDLSATAVPRSS